MKALRSTDGLRFLAVALLLVEAGIHLQQYVGPLHDVPTISTLFVLNAIGGAAIALVLSADRGLAGALAALAGIGMTLGALVSLAIARASTIFDYSEPTLRTAVTFAAIVELAAVLALCGFLVARAGDPRATGAAA